MYFFCVLLYRKRLVATGVNRFLAVLLYFPNCETGNRKNPKSGQPQLVVRLHLVVSGLVSVFFSVHATGLADTNHNERIVNVLSDKFSKEDENVEGVEEDNVVFDGHN